MFLWLYHFARKLLFDEKSFGRWAFAGVGVASYIVGQNSESIAMHFQQPWIGPALDYICGGIIAGTGASSTRSIKEAASEAKQRRDKP